MEQEYTPTVIKIKHKVAKSLDKTLNIALTVLLVVVLTGLILSICTGYKPLFVMSPSMEPAIKTHQFILAKRVEVTGHELNIGDIITYQKPGSYKTITHRIIQMEDDGYIVKGDNNAEADPYTVKPEWIKYKIIDY